MRHALELHGTLVAAVTQKPYRPIHLSVGPMLTIGVCRLDQVPSLQASPTRANLITVLAEDIYFQLLPSEDGNDWRMKRCRLRSLSSESLLESLTHPSCPASERDKVVAIESWLAPIDADEGMPDEGMHRHPQVFEGTTALPVSTTCTSDFFHQRVIPVVMLGGCQSSKQAIADELHMRALDAAAMRTLCLAYVSGPKCQPSKLITGSSVSWPPQGVRYLF